VNVEDVDELGLEQGADVHPFLVHLLHSTTRRKNDGTAVRQGMTIPRPVYAFHQSCGSVNANPISKKMTDTDQSRDLILELGQVESINSK
jgi:hypothetical protein